MKPSRPISRKHGVAQRRSVPERFSEAGPLRPAAIRSLAAVATTERRSAQTLTIWQTSTALEYLLTRNIRIAGRFEYRTRETDNTTVFLGNQFSGRHHVRRQGFATQLHQSGGGRP